MELSAAANPIMTNRTNTFAWNTMKERFPRNIREVTATNPDLSDLEVRRLERLAEAVSRGDLIPPPPLPAFDYETWMHAYLQHPGARWDDAQWFYSETYAYRLVLDACRYWEHRRDPYWYIKQSEYDADTVFSIVQAFSSLEETEPGGAEESLLRALHASLLGNKSDLSFQPESRGLVNQGSVDRDKLIADDGIESAKLLLRAESPMHLILDNSGSELAGDLILAREIIRITGVSVVLHVKLMPTFVSDTTAEDVHHCIAEALKHEDPRVCEFARDLKLCFANGRIILAPDDYWGSPLFLEAMPERLQRYLSEASAVVIKGDLNYRRAVRDTIWPAGVSVQQAMGSVQLPGMILLRVMKSDVTAGFSRETIEQLDQADPQWRTNGQRGVIQLVN